MTANERKEKWLQFHRFQYSRELKYIPAISRALHDQYKPFIDLFKQGVNPVLAAGEVTLSPLIPTIKNIWIDCAIGYGAKIRAYLPKIKARMPMGFSEEMTQIINQLFADNGFNDVQNISDTTKDWLIKMAQDGLEQGLSVNDIVAQIQGSDFTRVRARLITRTESVSATNEGAFIAAQNTGLSMLKVWTSARDKRVRRDHMLVDNEAINMDDLFMVGTSHLSQPGDRKHGAAAKEVCNCRCVAIYEPRRNDAGRLLTR